MLLPNYFVRVGPSAPLVSMLDVLAETITLALPALTLSLTNAVPAHIKKRAICGKPRRSGE